MKVHSMKWIGEWAEITTLFLDRHYDNIQIYIHPQGDDEYLLTDDGYTINDLEISGCSFDTSGRQTLLETTIDNCGAKLNGSAIEIVADGELLSHKIYNLLLAMFAVNALFDFAQVKMMEAPGHDS